MALDPLTPELAAALREQRRFVDEVELKTERVVPWVFCRSNGKPVATFLKAWRAACEEAGHPGMLRHDFRRTAARNLIRAGVPQTVAMQLTGHLTPSVFRRYAITDDPMLVAAVGRLGELQAADRGRAAAKVLKMRKQS